MCRNKKYVKKWNINCVLYILYLEFEDKILNICKLLNEETIMGTKTLDQHIETRPDIAGGKPCISGHRITVQNIVIWHEWMGQSADEIATAYNLSLADVYAALAYYYDHKTEVDESIKESKAFVEALRQQIPSKIKQKLNE